MRALDRRIASIQAAAALTLSLATSALAAPEPAPLSSVTLDALLTPPARKRAGDVDSYRF